MNNSRNCKECHKPHAHLYAKCNECRAKNCKHNEFHFDAVRDIVCNYCGTILGISTKKFKRGVKPFRVFTSHETSN